VLGSCSKYSMMSISSSSARLPAHKTGNAQFLDGKPVHHAAPTVPLWLITATAPLREKRHDAHSGP